MVYLLFLVLTILIGLIALAVKLREAEKLAECLSQYTEKQWTESEKQDLLDNTWDLTQRSGKHSRFTSKEELAEELYGLLFDDVEFKPECE